MAKTRDFMISCERERLEEILAGTGIQAVEYIAGANNIDVRWDEGQEVLEAVAQAAGREPAAQFEELPHKVQEAVLEMAAGSITWALDGKLDHESVTDTLRNEPALAKSLRKE